MDHHDGMDRAEIEAWGRHLAAPGWRQVAEYLDRIFDPRYVVAKLVQSKEPRGIRLYPAAAAGRKDPSATHLWATRKLWRADIHVPWETARAHLPAGRERRQDEINQDYVEVDLSEPDTVDLAVHLTRLALAHRELHKTNG
ncbi:hypothetical protein [Streptomyces hydrogenans]|uniref:DUF5655 domain-containing protein n=1 Tax=Streptomyces hydrogenans TaxID=1873719 RepID=A0ABQ3PMJ3_9ACTN|nr:hypothetical protein [Streptomyces hydrogenans]GHE31961.1 hypothetical protein GCM10018784_80630 [Streptomyces hydrogenans]GHI26230.1 hypothetical protein Shyd_76010 [Streptomyces hydrogenans]